MECGIFVLCTFLCLTFYSPTSFVSPLWPSHVCEFDMPGMKFVSCFIGSVVFCVNRFQNIELELHSLLQ